MVGRRKEVKIFDSGRLKLACDTSGNRDDSRLRNLFLCPLREPALAAGDRLAPTCPAAAAPSSAATRSSSPPRPPARDQPKFPCPTAPAPPEWLASARKGLGAGRYLVHRRDDRSIASYEIERGWTRIGPQHRRRSSTRRPSVSRRHALVRRRAGQGAAVLRRPQPQRRLRQRPTRSNGACCATATSWRWAATSSTPLPSDAAVPANRPA